MKPLKLTMTAFGPYKNTEIIDFTELEGNKLFVISGNTGAGKTTIFDGICFALYGSASGTDREDNRMLRSDFADDDTHTSVELEFELNGHFYRVFRQLGHVKQGNKTKTGERYEFYEEVDGKDIPCVDRQMVSEINKKAEALIGLTQDQFKQIVMLPQGEFRKLLTSETENKEAILRRIFKTESYKQLNELLKQKKDDVRKKFDREAQMRDHYIQTIFATLPKREESPLFQILDEAYYNVHQVITGLDDEIQFYHDQIAADQQTYEQAYNKHGQKQSEFHEAKALNDRFQELEQKEKQLKKLQKQVPAFTQKEKQLEAAERASKMDVYESQAADWRKEEQTKASNLKQAQTASQQAATKLENAQSTYKQEESNQGKRDETSKQLDRLQEFLPTVKDIEERKRYLDKLKQQTSQAHHDLEKATVQLREKSEAADNLNKQMNTMDQAVSQLPEKQQALNDMREQVRVLMKFLELKQKQTQVDQDLQTNETAFLDAKRKYDELEQDWMHNQASVLAAHLHDGERCPVCGSFEHPHKAGDHEKDLTKEQLEACKKELDVKDRRYRDAAATQKSNASQLEEKKEELMQYQIQSEDAETLKEQLTQKGKQLNEDVETLKKQSEDLKKTKEAHVQATEALKQLETAKDRLNKTYQDQHTSYEKAKAVYDERLRNIPEEVRVLAELEKQIKQTTEQKSQLEKAWEDAQVKLQQAKEEQAKATAEKANAEKQLAETSNKREKSETTFKTALEQAGFESEEAYQQAKTPPSERDRLKASIQQFNESRSALTQVVTDLRAALNDKQKMDLTAIQTQLDQLKQAYEQALKQLNLSKEYHQDASDLKVNIMETNERVVVLEKELATITDLYDVLRGQNDQKISFERYLQIEYLERIIEAANGRLKDLSNGQFYLMRSDRQESHGRQSGLALDVYDAYTGQTRDVKTLSGGEKFNASLCLALGMSDVIQSFQGNISIDTMFIDEGFGSLDEETLNKSVDTLIDLQQSGRMIGVISHVQDLKAMLPARLDVVKTKEGSSRTEFVT
ncbi:SbcC/MukB-like Walker B domain-containing protein [Lentibacillus salicampi]|uniref:Nuclease SbcCD subunit C n=1 Tax=Lentibacillus salicampi TaxID=175306 RepID=A0A4Y9AC63_9BACI|nr:SMC family ATPase [Lentibacillus salicampi]TFJ92510.1 SMC family ATPase [Lentibacillus salicampi]